MATTTCSTNWMPVACAKPRNLPSPGTARSRSRPRPAPGTLLRRLLLLTPMTRAVHSPCSDGSSRWPPTWRRHNRWSRRSGARRRCRLVPPPPCRWSTPAPSWRPDRPRWPTPPEAPASVGATTRRAPEARASAEAAAPRRQHPASARAAAPRRNRRTDSARIAASSCKRSSRASRRAQLEVRRMSCLPQAASPVGQQVSRAPLEPRCSRVTPAPALRICCLA
mmetsp:Transcript_101060/g.264014  ORF Transcript_101060/g.264014 Transcript_101060/m.264014 type:complete len:223 (-) Transcript_101060:174-842(-)